MITILSVHIHTLAILAPHAGVLVHAVFQAVVGAGPTPTPGTGGSGGSADLWTFLDNVTKFITKVAGYWPEIGLALCGLYASWGRLVYIASGGSPTLHRQAHSIWWTSGVGFLGVILAIPFANTLKGFF